MSYSLATLVLEPLRALAIGACMYGLIELLRPAVRYGPFRIRVDREAFRERRAAGDGLWSALRVTTEVGEGLSTDLVHRFVNPPVIGAAVVLLSTLFMLGLEAMGDPRAQLEAHVSAWPFWVQVLIGSILTDFAGYWRHRMFHTTTLWPVHAVHHSSTQLDWMSTERFHPINQVVTNLVHIGLLWMLGFPLVAIAATTTIRGVYGTFAHANLDLSYGPLDYVFVSPRFHRWHHSSDEEAIDKNFATLFSAFDVMFGTAYIPNRAAQSFGLHDDKLDESYLAQLGYPFEVWTGSRDGEQAAE